MTKNDLIEMLKTYNEKPANAEIKCGPIGEWVVSAITDMSALFFNLKNFNEDVSNWDTSEVTDMSFMFQGASAFDQDLNFVTSSVTDMSNMFRVRSSP